MSGGLDVEINKRRRRELLAKSEQLRLEALAGFPLRVASMAYDLKRLLRVAHYGPGRDACNEFAKRIRDEFVRTFGFDVFEAIGQTEASFEAQMMLRADQNWITVEEYKELLRHKANLLKLGPTGSATVTGESGMSSGQPGESGGPSE